MLAQLQQKGYKTIYGTRLRTPHLSHPKSVGTLPLYSFPHIQQEGIPPFRPLLMDDPKDERLRTISDQYMIGYGMMAAPLYENKKSRKVYFPKESGTTSTPMKSTKVTVNMR